MAQERLTREDARILGLETGNVRGHTCKVLLLDGRVELDDLRSRILARLDRAPRLRQRLLAPRGFGRPVWVDDATFDIAAQVRSLEIGRPLPPTGLAEVVARLMCERLDRARPLWRVDLVGGLESGGSAVVWKVHHCMADGHAMMGLGAAVLWDRAPEPEPAQAAEDAARRAGEAARVVRARRRWKPDGVLRRELAPGAGETQFDRRAGPARRVGFAAADLEVLRRAGKAVSQAVTVNDVVLAVVTGAVRRWLIGRGAPVTRGIRVKVPVSLHGSERAATAIGNRDSYFFVDLPVAEPDPARRLLAINAETSERKRHRDAELIYRLPSKGLLARWAMSPHVFTFNVSNVPGPREPLYVAGARVRELFTVAEIAQHHALRVAVVSASGRLGFGLCADRDAVPDFELLVEGLESSLRELAGGTGG